MARYKLRVPGAGTYLYGDGPEAVVADSTEEARELLDEFEVHSSIGWCRVLRKADIDGGDCFEDAEPGDTQVEYCHDDGRELRENECRVWHPGPPPLLDWRIEPIGPEPVDFAEIPVGTRFTLEKRTSLDDELVIVSPARPDGDAWEIDVRRFGEESEAVQTVRVAKGSFIYLMPYIGNFRPPYRYRLTVQGEVAEGSEDEMHALLRWVEAEMADQWRRRLHTNAVTPPNQHSREGR